MPHRFAFVLALVVSCAALADPVSQAPVAQVPLPRPRPAEVPHIAADPVTAAPEMEDPQEPPPPSACRLALTDAVAIAPSIPPINGPGLCGGDDLVRLEAVVLSDRSRVPLKPAATLRCSMAAALAEWIRTDITALASELGTAAVEIDNFDSYNCRGRNRVAGAQISEHGKANALDVRGIRLADGRMLSLTDRTLAPEVREKVKASACTRFSTVLGPGSDWYHEDHVHLDLVQRRSGFKLCQWEVWEPLPALVPLPQERPADPSAQEGGDNGSSSPAAGKER